MSKTSEHVGCILILLGLIVGLTIGFGIAAFLTWLISLLGLITFTWQNSLVVWGIIIILGLIFRS